MSFMDADEIEWRPLLKAVEPIMPRPQVPVQKRDAVPLPPTRTEQAFMLWDVNEQIGWLYHLRNALEAELVKVQETQVAHGPEFDLVIKGKDVTQAFHAEAPVPKSTAAPSRPPLHFPAGVRAIQPAVPEPVVNMRSNMSPEEWRERMSGPINESRLPIEPMHPKRGPDGSPISLEEQAKWEADQIASVEVPF